MILLQDPEKREWGHVERTEPGLLSFLLPQFLPWACPDHLEPHRSCRSCRVKAIWPSRTWGQALALRGLRHFAFLSLTSFPTSQSGTLLQPTRKYQGSLRLFPRRQHGHANVWTDSGFKFGSWKSETTGTNGISCAAWIQLVHQCLVSGGRPDVGGGGAREGIQSGGSCLPPSRVNIGQVVASTPPESTGLQISLEPSQHDAGLSTSLTVCWPREGSLPELWEWTGPL